MDRASKEGLYQKNKNKSQNNGLKQFGQLVDSMILWRVLALKVTGETGVQLRYFYFCDKIRPKAVPLLTTAK